MPVVDINIHHLPEDLFSNERILNGFLNSAPRGFGEIARVETLDSGKQQLILEKPKGYQNLNYVDGDYSAEAKLAAMDDAGVDYGVMRVPVWQEWLGLETCREVNDNAAEIVKRSSGRLFSTACVPPWGGKENVYELERCIKDLGAVGVQVACHYGQLYLDDEVFRPYLKIVSDLDIPVIVHHTPLPVEWQQVIAYTNLRREFGRIVDQATAVGRELFSGLFLELPNLRFIHTMLGGNWFANTALLTPADRGIPHEQHLLRPHPSALLGQGPGRVRAQGQRARSLPVWLLVPRVLRMDESGRGVHAEHDRDQRGRSRSGALRQRKAPLQPSDLIWSRKRA